MYNLRYFAIPLRIRCRADVASENNFNWIKTSVECFKTSEDLIGYTNIWRRTAFSIFALCKEYNMLSGCSIFSVFLFHRINYHFRKSHSWMAWFEDEIFIAKSNGNHQLKAIFCFFEMIVSIYILLLTTWIVQSQNWIILLLWKIIFLQRIDLKSREILPGCFEIINSITDEL